MKNIKHTYIVGEIGQNHNGSVDIAKLIIDLVSRPVKEQYFNLNLEPIDAVKLTKRDLDEELSFSQMNKIYNNENSFGKTYGEHRQFLELDDNQHFEIYKYAKSKNLDFVETICAVGAMSLLKLFTPDRLKVASRDLTNLPLLEALAETKIPIILSTGMGGEKELNEALEVISKIHSDISILHCVSQYPTYPGSANLNTIKYLKNKYPQYKIGYSDHTIGISAPVIAVGMEAEIIEKHITIDRNMKGTDHKGSLGPDGVNRMLRDIRLAEMFLGEYKMFIDDCVIDARKKLERSIASNKFLKKGHILTIDDIHMLSPGDGLKWTDKNKLLGKKMKTNIQPNEIIYPNDVE